MGHHYICPVLPRRPALRPILDFHPLCRWCCSRIHNRIVVCSPLVLLISLHTLTLHSIQGSVAQHTPMCFTFTERPGLATSPKCSVCASLTLSPSSSCYKIPAPAPWFANHHFTLTSRGAQSRTTQPYKSVTKMCRMLFYLHSGQTIPRLISRSSSIQADRQAVDLNWSHAIGDGSTISW